MGKPKGRPSPASQRSATTSAPPPSPPPAIYSWWTLGIGLLVVLLLCGGWWYGFRPRLLRRQAVALWESDPPAAAALLEEAVATSPVGFRDAHVQWARALLRSGRWDEALGCFSQIDSPGLADSQELLQLADEASAANVNLLAVMALEAVAPTDAHRSEAIEKLIPLKLRSGNDPAAEKLVDELARLSPDSPSPWLIRARGHEQRAALPEAAADYRELLARERNPARRAEGLRSMIRILIHLGEREEARKRLDELSLSSVDHTLLDQLHDAQLKRLEGDIEGAWTQVGVVLKSDGTNLPALELRGALAMDRGDAVAAATDFQAVVNQQPWSQKAQYKLSQALARQGKTEDAAKHLAESRRLLQLSLRILELRARRELTAAEVDELASAMEQTGLKAAAERLRQNPAR